jgi:hypothetical protein
MLTDRLTAAQVSVLRIGAVLMILGGPIALGFAVRFPGSGSDNNPVPVQAGTTVTLAEPGLFGDRPILYGAVPSGQEPPTVKTLGCVLRSSSGRELGLFDLPWVDHKPQVVSGKSLSPMLEFASYTSGATLTCSGPAMSAAAPTYLLRGGLDPGFARVVISIFGVMSTVVGITFSLILRPRPSPR